MARLLYRAHQFLKTVIMNSFAANCPLLSVRMFFYRLAGLKIGQKTRINPNCFFSSSNISIGCNSFVNRFCEAHDGLMGGAVFIGNNCYIAFNVVFCLVSHEIGNSHQRAGKRIGGNIIIGDGSWIGANTTIMPNVKIGKGVVIAAGSLVNKDCEDNCLYAGVPAKKIKELQ